MTRELIINRYFNWMYDLVCSDCFKKRLSYRKLLRYLYDMDFIYIIGQDGNRAEDGIELRYRFGQSMGYSDALISNYLDDKDCSVLEMMVALCLRCEEHIMEDYEVGDRTGKWFWDMVENLRLDTETDTIFDKNYVDDVMHRFLFREYEPNGEGSLFTLHNRRVDLRTEEIWYQMMWYLDEVMKN